MCACHYRKAKFYNPYVGLGYPKVQLGIIDGHCKAPSLHNTRKRRKYRIKVYSSQIFECSVGNRWFISSKQLAIVPCSLPSLVSVHFEPAPPHSAAPEDSKRPGTDVGHSLVCMCLPPLTHQSFPLHSDAHPPHHLCCRWHLLATTVTTRKLLSVA